MSSEVFSASVRRRRQSDTDRDAGYSFPEILISLVLMGVLMGAVMAAMSTAIRASSISDEAAELDAVLGAAADSLGDALFVACPEASSPNAYLEFVQTGADAMNWAPDRVQIVAVQYWDPHAPPGVSPWVASNGVGSGQCDSTVWLSSAKTMQKVVVEATTPDGSDSRILEIVMTDIRPKD